MTRIVKNWWVPTLLALLGSLGPVGSAAAIEFDEVRNFEDVFVISAAAPTRDRIEVRWAIEGGYYLYNNQFLRFTPLDERVVLGAPQLPAGEVSFDELLGAEVEKFHGELTVTLPLVEVPDELQGVELRVRSQGCLEDELCYPPTEQSVRVDLPPAAPIAGPAGSAGDLFPGLTAGPGDDLPGKDLLAAGAPAALPPEEAFVYEAIAFDADTALVRLTAQAGYYLYTEKLAFRASGAPGVAVRAVELPAGVTKDDPEFGPVPVYFGQVEIPVHLTRPPGPATGITLQADFQGCRDGDICYPPMSRSVTFEMPPVSAGDLPEGAIAAETKAAAVPAQDAAPLSEQDRLAGLLTRNPAGALAAFFVAGLLLAFTPCVFPMLPILSGIILGQGARLTTPRAFWLSLVYVLAMAVTYTVAGVLAGLFGQNLQAVFQNPWIISGFVLVFVLLALSMFGFYELQLPGRLQTRLAEASNRQRGGELWGVAVMGFLSALIVGPCVAPPLMAALIVIGSSGDAVLGGAALFALSMGMGVPLLLFGVTAGKFVPRAGAWMNAVKAVFGVGLLALAIWMLERILPGPAIMLLWGALAIGCGVWLGALERIEAGASGWRRLWKSLGVLLLLLGALEIIGAAAGGDYWLRPLAGFNARSAGAPAQDHPSFVRIKSLRDLEHAVAAAGQGGRGAMLDFYADWCVECKRMERNTFPDPGVQALLARLQPLQADVTANDADDQALMQAFGIIGPPAILFFDRNGEELKPFRLVGYFDPAEFSTHLGRVLDAQ